MKKDTLLAEIDKRINEHRACVTKASTCTNPDVSSYLLESLVLVNTSSAIILEDLKQWINGRWGIENS